MRIVYFLIVILFAGVFLLDSSVTHGTGLLRTYAQAKLNSSVLQWIGSMFCYLHGFWKGIGRKPRRVEVCLKSFGIELEYSLHFKCLNALKKKLPGLLGYLLCTRREATISWAPALCYFLYKTCFSSSWLLPYPFSKYINRMTVQYGNKWEFPKIVFHHCFYRYRNQLSEVVPSYTVPIW